MITAPKRFRPSTTLGAIACLALTTVAYAGTPFTNEGGVRGLIYQIQDYPQTVGYLGTGCGFADLDADGDPDVVIIGRVDGVVGIFENDGAGNFTDRSATSGIPALSKAAAFSAGDYDGDGAMDLYISQLGLPNVLMKNQGNFTFTDEAATALVDDVGSGQGSTWGDYNGDGWLDLYLCNYNAQIPSTEAIDNKLYENRANGTFNDVGVAQTVDDQGHSFQSVFFDMDRDGDLDLYVSNDRGHLPATFGGQAGGVPNQLWRNDNGNYVNVSAGSGAGLALFSMGVACGDFDGDRYPDLYVTNIPNDGSQGAFPLNPLFLNNGGDGTFTESSGPTGTANDIVSASWGAIFFDFDNDGTHELYVNNQFEANTFYHHAAGFPCLEIAADVNLQGTSFTGTTGVSFASAIADVDGDGDLDLLENNLGTNVQLYINNEGSTSNWIRYRVSGLHPNVFGVGANVETKFGATYRYAEVLAGGNGYLGQNELTLHVGAGSATVADEVVVVWPGGAPTRTLTNLPVNQVWTLYPPEQLGDADLDGEVLVSDFVQLTACLALGTVSPGCEMMDFDGDGDVDDLDADQFILAFDGIFDDCNDNGLDDLQEILDGTSLDANGTGVPDECEVFGDTNSDGIVDVDDLVNVILAWGPCLPAPALCEPDIDGNKVIDVDDLVLVILNWTL